MWNDRYKCSAPSASLSFASGRISSFGQDSPDFCIVKEAFMKKISVQMGIASLERGLGACKDGLWHFFLEESFKSACFWGALPR